MLVVIILTTFCSTVTTLPQSVCNAGNGTKVRQSQYSTMQQSRVEACAPNAETSYSDNRFLTTDWFFSSLSIGTSIPGNTATYVSSGGNPGDFLNLRMISGTPYNVYFVHLLKSEIFFPSAEGEIVSIDGGYDLKNQLPNNTPTSVALLLYQNGAYYRGPWDSISAPIWTSFSHSGLKATDFLNISNTGPPNPNFSCAGKPIQVGFVALTGRVANGNLLTGIDNWSIRFRTTCCNVSPVNNTPTIFGGRVGPIINPAPINPAVVRSKCCCDDEEAVVDQDGTVILPGNVDMDTPPVFEYVDQEVGNVADLYPGANTNLDTWYDKYPCKTAIGGSVPKEADEPNLDIGLEEMGIVGVSPQEIIDKTATWEKMIADKERELTRVDWIDPAAPNYTPPLVPYSASTRSADYAFGGRDIVFVHGLMPEQILDRIDGTPAAAQVNWKEPTSFPANTTNPEFYTGYYKRQAELNWMGQPNVTSSIGGHINEFLLKKGYKNRFLIVSYNSSERLEVAVKAVLAQIGDAMRFGIGVVDPLNRNAPPPQNFGTPSFVIVSHSTGSLVTDVALTAAAQVPSLNAAYIASHCKAHIAAHGAHRGSRYATAAVALSGFAAIAAPPWLWPLVKQQFLGMSSPNTAIPDSPFGFATISKSILVDLVPLVSQEKWGDMVRDTPVRTLTVVGGHPTHLAPLKYLLQPGFDDSVTNINSQLASPNNVLVWPSGFRTDAAGLIKNFDMGVFGVVPNVSVSIGGGLPINFTVQFSNNSLKSPSRAIGYYIDQKFDRVSSPGNILAFPEFFFAAGATPYHSPTGMLQTVNQQFGSGTGDSANPYNRNPNIFSFLQSASDHFKGTHHQMGGFNGVWYGSSPFLKDNDGEKNFEEGRVITDLTVFAPFPMPYGDNEPLLRTQNMAPVVERIRGLKVTFKLRIFKKTWTRSLWVWKRHYNNLLKGWETKRQFDYVYESVLKN